MPGRGVGDRRNKRDERLRRLTPGLRGGRSSARIVPERSASPVAGALGVPIRGNGATRRIESHKLRPELGGDLRRAEAADDKGATMTPGIVRGVGNSVPRNREIAS